MTYKYASEQHCGGPDKPRCQSALEDVVLYKHEGFYDCWSTVSPSPLSQGQSRGPRVERLSQEASN